MDQAHAAITSLSSCPRLRTDWANPLEAGLLARQVKERPDLEGIAGFLRDDKFLISKHARIRMFERNISTDDIKGAIMAGEIIEEYAADEPCPSALVLGFLESIPYHVVVAECDDHVRIVTVYKPEEDRWIGYKVRR